jgi:hypothetical protein
VPASPVLAAITCEEAAGTGYGGAAQIAARLLDKIVETVPLKVLGGAQKAESLEIGDPG